MALGRINENGVLLFFHDIHLIMMANSYEFYINQKREDFFMWLKEFFMNFNAKYSHVRYTLFNNAKVLDFLINIAIVNFMFISVFMSIYHMKSVQLTVAFIIAYLMITLLCIKGKFFRKKDYRLTMGQVMFNYSQGFVMFEALFRYFLLWNNDPVIVISKDGSRRYHSRYLMMQEHNLKAYTDKMTRKDLGYIRYLSKTPNVDLGAGLYASVPFEAIVEISTE
jgi:hypothetical protein